MPEEVEVDVEEQLMRVQFGSNSTVHDWKSTLKQVERLSRETGICRVVVDVRKQEFLADTSTLFTFAASLPRSIAFAILCELHLDMHRFIENVALNRGMFVKDFESEQEAIEWLKNCPNKIICSNKK